MNRPDSIHPLSRRDLLRYLGVGGALLCTGRAGRAATSSMASPLGWSALHSTSDKTLIVVQLSGGNDGLNTVVPVGNDDYHRARPRLAMSGDGLHRLNDATALHPALGKLAQCWRDGGAAIVQGVGYPEPNRSHFKSMDIWHSGRPGQQRRDSGWLGRSLAALPADGRGTECAVNLSTQEPLALQGGGFHPVSFRNAERFRLRTKEGQEAAVDAITGAAADAEEILELVGRTAADARGSSERIRKAVRDYGPKADYPGNRFGQSLRTTAALLNAGLGSRVIYTYLGSFDTHANQGGRHATLLQQLDSGLAAFQQDLQATGQADRVAILVFSEFGRRVAENASGGTDHGTAGPVFLLGSGIQGGLHGEAPDLAKLDRGDLVYTTDFRSIYRDVLTDWLAVDAGEFEDLPSLGLFG